MATKLKDVDAVVIGMGFCGAILSRELTRAGLNVVGLERGADHNPAEEFTLTRLRDELRYVVRIEIGSIGVLENPVAPFREAA